MKIRNFFLMLRLHTRQAFFHKKSAIATIVSWGLRVALTLLLYNGIYKLLGTQAIKGITFNIAASSMMLYAVYSGFGGRDMFRIINNEYKSGSIEIWFNKPIAYLSMKMAENIGKNLPSALGLILCMVVFWSFRGIPETDHTIIRLLCGIGLLFMGIIISYLMYSLIGLSAIWLEDASPVFAINDKLVMVFGGVYIPIAFFPHWFRMFGESLPVGATNFLTQIFYPDFFTNLPRFVMTQCIWIILLGWAVYAVNKAAYSRLTVNGG